MLGDFRVLGPNRLEVTILEQTRVPVGEQEQSVIRFELDRDEPVLPGDYDGDGAYTIADLNAWHAAPVDVNGDGITTGADVAQIAASVTEPYDDCNGNHWPDDAETDPIAREDSGALAPVGAAHAQSYRVLTREHVTGDVIVTVTAAGDLEQLFELLTVSFDDTVLGNVMQTAPSCAEAIDSITIPMATWNAQVDFNAAMELTIVGNGAVGAEECAEPTWARLTLEIPRVNPRDTDGDRIPDACHDCPGDLDQNGMVDFADLVAVLASWGPCNGCPGDLDGDANVGFNRCRRAPRRLGTVRVSQTINNARHALRSSERSDVRRRGSIHALPDVPASPRTIGPPVHRHFVFSRTRGRRGQTTLRQTLSRGAVRQTSAFPEGTNAPLYQASTTGHARRVRLRHLV